MRFFSKRKLLQGTQGILSQRGVSLLGIKNANETLDKVRLLEQVGSPQAFTRQSVYEGHSIFDDSLRTFQKPIKDTMTLVQGFVGWEATQEVHRHIEMDDLLD